MSQSIPESSSSEPLTMHTTSTSVNLRLASDFGDKLSSYNGATPLVHFTLDTSKVNATFNTVFEMLGALHGVLTDVCATVNRHDNAVNTLRGGLDELREKFENDPRFAAIESKLSDHTSRIGHLEGKVSGLGGKIEALDHRMNAQEAKKVDFSPIEREITIIKKEMNAIGEHTSSIAEETRSNTVQIKACEAELERLRGTKRSVEALYAVFEMVPDHVMEVVSGSGDTYGTGACSLVPAGAAGASPSACTAYCLELPSFSALRGSLSASLNAAVKALQQSHSKDVATLSGRIADKADTRDLQALGTQLSDVAKKCEAVNTRTEKLTRELQCKMDADAAEAKLAHLEAAKADRAELVGLLQRGDLGGVEGDIATLQRALDSIMSQMNLELSELRSASRAANTTVPARSNSGSRRSSLATADPSVLSRLDVLEEQTRGLEDRKADKSALQSVYEYVDGAIEGLARRRPSRPGTPVAHPIGPAVPPPSDAPQQGQRHGALQPLTRPPSAGREPARATIPETVRPPSPSLQYTSSPLKYMPNNAKYRATATLFDSDGGRTNASVTAARAVPHIDHVTNVSRSAAGTEEVPHDHKVHTMAAA